jgi:hypothetical protein
VWQEDWLHEGVLTGIDPVHNHAFFVESKNTDLIDDILLLHPYATPSFSSDPYIDTSQQFVLLYIPSEALGEKPQ